MEFLKQFVVTALFAALSLSAATASAQSSIGLDSNKKGISVSLWTEDIERFDERVIRELRNQFNDDRQSCEKGRFGHYFDAYQEQLDALRDEIQPVTFLILREIMLSNGRELGPMHESLPCPEVNRWQLLETAIRSKLSLIGNSLTLLELSGSLSSR